MNLRAERLLAAMGAHLGGLRDEVARLDGRVAGIDRKADDLRLVLDALANEFARFVAADEQQKTLALAATNLVRINQEIERRFGAYEVVRRTATGILQAVDTKLVRVRTLEHAAEKHMLETPGYWLAAATVALSAWAADDRMLAERALLESLERDDTKSSLFFALVCRRANRLDVSLRWLDRYFRLQDPFALEPEAVVLLDALACGVFGAASRRQGMRAIAEWTEAMRERVGVVEAERARWIEATTACTPPAGADEYAYLKRYSPTWPRLESTLQGARVHGEMLRTIETLFAGAAPYPAVLARRVDALIDRLVTNFDAVERPLRRDRRHAEILIERAGDRAAAATHIAREDDAHGAVHSFATVLTNGALGLGALEISRGTRRLCYALSAPWIAEAHDDLTARTRANAPTAVALAIEGWTGSTRDGGDERELLDSLETHLRAEERRAAGRLSAPATWWPLLLAACAFAWTIRRGGDATGLSLGVGLLLVQLVVFVRNRFRLRGAREHYREARRAGASIVRACCAELVDLREVVAREDARAAEVQRLLASLQAEEAAQAALENRRLVLA